MRAVRPLTPRLARAYRLSSYWIGGMQVRIGQAPSGPWALPVRHVIVLGACNPGGRRSPDGVNARMMRGLAARLAHVWHGPASGGLGTWWEPMLAAALPPARAVVLARLFGQNAIVVVHRGRRSRLIAT